MKSLFVLALLTITTIANAQPGHGRDHGKGHYKKNHKNNHYDKKDYKHGRKLVRDNHRTNYHYHVERELNRYEFLRLNNGQRKRLETSLHFLISNNYGGRDYEIRLRKDLRNILSRSQYDLWYKNAYRNGGNTFVFNFNR